MTSVSRRWWVLLGLALLGCGDDDDSSGGGTGGSGSTVLPAATCNQLCQNRATACNAPAGATEQICGPLCNQGITQEQASCLTSRACSELSSIQDPASFQKICPASGGGSGGSGGGTSTGGTFGDPCKCKADSDEGGGRFECFGTNICSTGLQCVGDRIQGVDKGTCVGPICCTSESDCAAKLGSSQGCASDQKCACTHGDLECVGDKCTCSDGASTSQGLCYPR